LLSNKATIRQKNPLYFYFLEHILKQEGNIMNYKNLIGQKVISIFDGKIDSYIIDAVFRNHKQLSKFIIADIENENHKILEIKNIFHIGTDGILISNLNKLIIAEYDYSKNLYMNKEIFDIEGKGLGKVTDIQLSQNYEIEKFITTNSSFEPNQIISINSVIIINNDKTHYKKHNFAPKRMVITQTTATQPVTINGTKIPIRVISSNSSLIGKKLFKDLINSNQIILAKKNTVINASILNLAKQHNLLNELTHSVF